MAQMSADRNPLLRNICVHLRYLRFPSFPDGVSVRPLKNGMVGHKEAQSCNQKAEHPTPNIQHRTPNGASVRRGRVFHWMFGVGCWAFKMLAGVPFQKSS
jgi:hypothetical protein